MHVVFDGGISRNPGGRAYGSFRVTLPFRQAQGPELVEGEAGIGPVSSIERVVHGSGPGHTCNTAEVETAIAALVHLLAILPDPAETRVHLAGDSQLAIRWLSGRRRPRSGQVARLSALIDRFHTLAARFVAVELTWHHRAHSVAILGH